MATGVAVAAAVEVATSVPATVTVMAVAQCAAVEADTHSEALGHMVGVIQTTYRVIGCGGCCSIH